jgi:hypothetical protein
MAVSSITTHVIKRLLDDGVYKKNDGIFVLSWDSLLNSSVLKSN